MKTIKTDWIAAEQLITTEISGDIDLQDVEQWERSIGDALAKVPDNGTFRIFVNLHGFKAINIDVHKKFRSIIPLTLSNYGWKVGYVNLFEEAADMPVTTTRGIRCTAAAHVHQDATKIEKYEENFGNDTEHFFTDPAKGESWIRSLA
jgi:hypothetical protein